MDADIIKISHLKKSFGDVKAVNDISFRVSRQRKHCCGGNTV